MINYNWNCRTVDVHPQNEDYTDIVYKVHWNVTGISDTLDPEGNFYASSNIGIQLLETDSVTEFIPFTNLTNADLVSWTKSAMGTERVNSIEENIESQISSSITPTSIIRTVG
tara:strand:+ start:387 stop:725 length:339 start_codon:yes stop_codon:yes gene_type:complete